MHLTTEQRTNAILRWVRRHRPDDLATLTALLETADTATTILVGFEAGRVFALRQAIAYLEPSERGGVIDGLRRLLHTGRWE